MANTVRWYTHESWSTGATRLVRTTAIGSASQAAGIYYDGSFYYLLDETTPTIIAYAYLAGAFYPVRTVWSGTLGIGSCNYRGITGNGKDLIVSFQDTYDPGGGVTVFKTLALVSKSGSYLRTVRSVGTGSVAPPWDVSYDGQYIHEACNRSSPSVISSAEKVWVDGSQTYVPASIVRTIESYTFDGLQPIYGITQAGNRVSVSDHFWLSALIRTSSALGQQVYGLTAVHDPGVGEYGEYDSFGALSLVAAVSRA